MKTAVILFNLGGPDKLESVQPFLYNLFNDKAIIGLPQPFRHLLARFISKKRKIKADAIYSQIGGKSPILELTNLQAAALQARLGEGYKVFVAMRYWHPMSAEVAAKVAEYEPDNIILLPLYPQFSTTTTGSSFADFKAAYATARSEYLTRKYHGKKPHIAMPKFKEICCYPVEANFIAAHVDLIGEKSRNLPNARVLFSAHGLPEKVIAKGDPYQWQVEQTAAAIAAGLGLADWRVCYQSKVGPLPWLKPNTADEITAAGAEGKDIILIPIAFTSEHSETLVELDIDFRNLAAACGVGNYVRIPALATHPMFIESLAGLCGKGYKCERVCPAEFGECGCFTNIKKSTK